MNSVSDVKIKKHVAKAIISFALFIGIALLLQRYVFDGLLSQSFWTTLEPSSFSVQLAFIAIAALSTMFGFPRQVIAFLAGYSLGFGYGTFIATLAVLLGCMLCYGFAIKLSERHQLRANFDLINRLSTFLSTNVFYKTLIIRLFPIGSNLLTNLAAGVSQVNKSQFFAASFIGYLPQMIIFSLSGSGVSMQSKFQLILSGVLLCISLALSLWLYKKERNQPLTNPFLQQK